MRDIADRLGVSSVTVSKALNDKEGVSGELKEKIKQLAVQMGYRYNATARSMKEGLTHNVGVIIPERFTGPTQSFYVRVFQRITKHLEDQGYYGILHILNSEDEEELSLPKLYSDSKVDGFIVLGQVSKEYIELVQSMDVPKMFLDFYDEHSDIDSVVTDNFYAAYEMTNYLIQQGHRSIAYVGNLYSTSSIQDRFLGYYKSLLEHRMPMNPDLVLNDRDERGTFIEINLPEQLPTAFVCNCDQVAHLLVQKLTSLGIQVPAQCSVVGFDNDIYAMLSEPKLTTVEVDIEQMARTAVQSMLKKIDNPNRSFGRVHVKGNIIYRESVSVAPETQPQVTTTTQ
ncbi:transcriptional regulator, LacI family [Paenibacillus polysaccharolyticus]|uniref:Transcriptional regulator, LacI family n=1 Tax=Paenibacillus polysaccharolyticus TaxID=582692 RepID=A0A1G5J896_9BACL|nr:MULTISPECIES: LacI family DNA-binding transcriptional regulator [Paenibacillus]SCY84532.1 transcriptional regulator, LacI family [Paenibacillus polysaccharolyticus]